MLQNDNTRRRAAVISIKFLEAEIIPFRAWLVFSPREKKKEKENYLLAHSHEVYPANLCLTSVGFKIKL